jgi:hypothetical protein
MNRPTYSWRWSPLLSMTLVLLVGLTGVAAGTTPRRDTNFFIPNPAVGDRFSTVFSIASSIQADGFDESVWRNSGSADNTLVAIGDDQSLAFDAEVDYDGTPRQRARNIIRDSGAISCWNADCQAVTDASGFLYNRLMWGPPRADLKPGMVWDVTMSKPWELGPAGKQTVTVLHVDDTDGSVTLRREGTAAGGFADESKKVTLQKNGQKVAFEVTPGTAHWIGLTTFRHGAVVNDELLVVRHDVLHSQETGEIAATQRRYILLNAAPNPTL